MSSNGIGGHEGFAPGFRKLYRGVHVPPDANVDPVWRMRGALKRAGGGAVIAGISAAILHGIAWYEDDFVVEVCRNAKGQGRNRGGINVVRSELEPDDVTVIEGLPVLSAVRTAYDLGRRRPEWRALGHLDDLLGAAGVESRVLWHYVTAHPDTRGVRQIRDLIQYVDTKSESPPESWLRLCLIRGGLPKPESQIALHDTSGQECARLDLGYRRYQIGVEFDGEEFHSNAEQRAHDNSRDAKARRLGWEIVRVRRHDLREDADEIVRRVEKLLWERGYRG